VGIMERSGLVELNNERRVCRSLKEF
jgi:hypothetical protein